MAPKKAGDAAAQGDGAVLQTALRVWIKARFQPRVVPPGAAFQFRWLEADGQLSAAQTPTPPLRDAGAPPDPKAKDAGGGWEIDGLTTTQVPESLAETARTQEVKLQGFRDLRDPEAKERFMATLGATVPPTHAMDVCDDAFVRWEREYPITVTEQFAKNVLSQQVEVSLLGENLPPATLRLNLGPLLMARADTPHGKEVRRGEDGKAHPQSVFEQKEWSWDAAPRCLVDHAVYCSWSQGALPGLLSWEAGIEATGPLLSEALAAQLRPLQIRLVAVKNLPIKHHDKNAVPVHAVGFPEVDAVTDSVSEVVGTLKTDDGQGAYRDGKLHTHGNEVRWDRTKVVFCEQLDPHALRRWLQHGRYVVEVHDRDQQQQVPSYGLARFSFADMLNPAKRSCRLRADVVPARGDIKIRYRRQKTEGIDVQDLLQSDTVEKLAQFTSSDKRREFTPAYLQHGTFLVVEVSKLAQILPATLAQREHLQKWPGPAHALVQVPASLQETQTRQEVAHLAENEHKLAAQEVAGYDVFEAKESGGAPRFRCKAQRPDGSVGPWRQLPDEAWRDAGLLDNEEPQADAKQCADWQMKEQPLPSELTDELSHFAADGPPVEGFALWYADDAVRAKQHSADGATGPWRKGEGAADLAWQDARVLAQLPAPRAVNCRYERFGRLVLVLEYAETHLVRTVLQFVNTNNEKVLQSDPVLKDVDVTKRLLTAEERTNWAEATKDLDLLTGFVVFDRVHRLVVVEGLRDGALHHLVDRLPRPKPNDRKITILYNKNIGFPARAYGQWKQLLQVKLRQPLEVLGQQSKVYDPALVDGSSRAVLTLLQMKRSSAIHRLTKDDTGVRDDGNAQAAFGEASFPAPPWLEMIEEHYGDFITDAELVGGVEAENEASEAQSPEEASASEPGTQELRAGTVEQAGRARGKHVRKLPTDQNNAEYLAYRKERQNSVPDFLTQNPKEVHEASKANESNEINQARRAKSMVDLSFLDQTEGQVFLYSGQTLASTELQKAAMRQKMLQDETRMWTYSPVYNTNTFPLTDNDPGSGKDVLRLRGEYVQHKNISAPSGAGPRTSNGKKPWRYPREKRKELFRKPERDLGPARPDELKEQWAENEWNVWPGAVRGLPMEPYGEDNPGEMVRPFDRNKIFPGKLATGVHVPNECFHDPEIFTSAVHIPAAEEQQKMHDIFRDAVATANGANLGAHELKTYAKVRHHVGSNDRTEPILKDPPTKLSLRPDAKLRTDDKVRSGAKKAQPVRRLPSSIHHHEPFHDDKPNVQFHARLRPNDGDPPYNVVNGTYIWRSQENTTKRGQLVGDLGPSPWQHTATRRVVPTDKVTALHESHPPRNLHKSLSTPALVEKTYVSTKNFDRYREDKLEKAPYRLPLHETSVWREQYLEKNAWRDSLTDLDKSQKNNTLKFRGLGTGSQVLDLSRVPARLKPLGGPDTTLG